MATQSRLGALNLLDAEWRRGVWKRWMRSLIDSDPPVAPYPPEASQRVSQAPSMVPPAAVPSMAPAVPTPTAAPQVAATPTMASPEPRRSEVRARFDALFDRLLAIEDTLDAFGKRFALRAVHDRRQEQRVLERLESTADALERQALALEAVTATLERIEQRVERVERWLRADGTPREAQNDAREGRLAQLRADLDVFDQLEQSLLKSEPPAPARSVPPDAVDAWDAAPFSNSSIRGNLAEMSLPTVLAMLELERRTGVLKVCAEDGAVVSATLRDGAVVGARVRELDSDPIEAIREALRFSSGHFWFRQAGVEVVSGPPRSVGSVLLEATRRNDEAVRVG